MLSYRCWAIILASDRKLARWMGHTQTFVARIESGQRRIDIIELMALAEIIGFDCERILRKVAKIENEILLPTASHQELAKR